MTTCKSIILPLLLSSITIVSSYIQTTNAVSESYRLPNTLHPTHYKVKVLTYLDDSEHGFKFSGSVWIKLNATESTDKIILHSKDLRVDSDKVKICEENAEKSVIESEKIELDLNNEFLIIPLKSQLEAGKAYEVFIPFEGDLLEGLLGYYRSSYYDQKEKKKKWISVTQFEAIFARRAFPCFDEPEFKAKFEIILGHNKDLKAISNMPIKSTEPIVDKENFIWTHFEDSVPMSTYLVAYSINEFEYREHTIEMKQNVTFRIWARPDALDQVDYALDIGPRVLKHYEEYFDVEFPLPKMDMIAIPDFSAGAMENWGLVTYRETALLYHPNISSAASKHRVAEVVAHELAHQWFGNLVTMKWWTDLWLNEGFATYIESLGVKFLHPEWQSADEETFDWALTVFQLDSLQTSHPVSVPIGNPTEIPQIFDAISYQKGALIIRMMNRFLGEDAFRNGVSNYLKEHAFGNAEQDDLWDSLTKEGHKCGSLDKKLTVKKLMDNWTLKPGYPLINAERNYEDGSVILKQSRYLADKNIMDNDVNECWEVPISYTNADKLDFVDTMPKTWLTCAHNDSMELAHVCDEDEWLLLNIQISGLYRVRYDDRNWNLLINTLNSAKHSEIHELNRGLLINDAFDLAWTGEQNYSIALRLAKYLEREKAYVPWNSALANLNSLAGLLKRTPQFGDFKKYIQHIMTPIYTSLGGIMVDESKNRSLHDIKLQGSIAGWACKYNVGDCIEKSLHYFKQWMETENPSENNPIPRDLRSTVYCSTLRNSDEKPWDFLWERYMESNVGAEKALILSSLGCTREVWILEKFLEMSLDSNSGIRKQDMLIPFSSVASNDIGYLLAKKFFLTNMERIHNYLKPDTSRLGRYISYLAKFMITQKELSDLEAFHTLHSAMLQKSSQSINQSFEKIRVNIQWHAKNYHGVIELLRNSTS